VPYVYPSLSPFPALNFLLEAVYFPHVSVLSNTRRPLKPVGLFSSDGNNRPVQGVTLWSCCPLSCVGSLPGPTVFPLPEVPLFPSGHLLGLSLCVVSASSPRPVLRTFGLGCPAVGCAPLISRIQDFWSLVTLVFGSLPIFHLLLRFEPASFRQLKSSSPVGLYPYAVLWSLRWAASNFSSSSPGTSCFAGLCAFD